MNKLKYDQGICNSVPDEIIRAAFEIQDWAKQHNFQSWEVCGIADRGLIAFRDLEIKQLRSELEASKQEARMWKTTLGQVENDLRNELDAERNKSINRSCLTEFTKAYEHLKANADSAIQDSDVSNAFALAVEAVNKELERTE